MRQQAPPPSPEDIQWAAAIGGGIAGLLAGGGLLYAFLRAQQVNEAINYGFWFLVIVPIVVAAGVFLVAFCFLMYIRFIAELVWTIFARYRSINRRERDRYDRENP